MRSDIERVVMYMYEHYSEPISLADMADVARLSQFHFSRTFLTATGVSPGRFLSAVRLHMAKGLLLTTSQTVTDISYMVGYNSLGTFTTRFTRSVGITPVQYRRASGAVSGIPCVSRTAKSGPEPSFDWFDGCGVMWFPQPAAGSIEGRVSVPPGTRLPRIYLGVFDGAIAQGPMMVGAVLEDSLTFRLPCVPEGEWHVMAVGCVVTDPRPLIDTGPVPMVGSHGPVKVIDGEALDVRLRMHGPRPTDPPILLALPDLVPWQPWRQNPVPAPERSGH